MSIHITQLIQDVEDLSPSLASLIVHSIIAY